MHRSFLRHVHYRLSFWSLPRKFAGAVVATIALLALAGSATAQLTTEALIGDAVSEPGHSRYSDIGEAIKRYNNRDLLGATKFVEGAKEKNESLPPVQLILAKMHYLSNNAAAGQASLEKAVTEDPGDPEPYLILAEQAFAAGQTIVAESLFARAIELTEDYEANAKRKRNFQIRSRAGRASVAERRTNWSQAEADLKAWLEVDPENANAHERLGQVVFMQDTEETPRASDGYQSFVTAHQLSDKLPNPLVAAALMYDRQNRDAEAKQSFERAYSENQTDETTLLAYSQWLIKQGEIAKAETILAGAQKAAPASANVWLLSGVAAKMADKPGPAEQYLMQALNLAPSNRDVYNQLALLLIEQPEQEKKNRAREFAAINHRLNENNPDVNVTLAWVLFQLGQGQQATAALQNALRLGSLSADGNFIVAKLLVQRNDNENAKRFLDAALEFEGIFVHRSEAEALRESIN